MAESTTTEGGTALEHKLEAMLEIERFDAPAEFRSQALLSDPAVYAEAERDPQAWWAKQAEALDWFERWDTVLDDANPPFYKWFTGGKLNASYNCLDRHVLAGRGERVAYHWRGEQGEERDVTYAELHRDVQRFANALKTLGVGKGDVVGIYLPMIPEVVVAMLACARIGAPHNVVFGGFSAESVKERMEFSEAKALITVDGARRKGKTAPIKTTVDEHMNDLASLETIVVVRHTGIECEMRDGRDVFYDEVLVAADPECPAEPLDAEHPLYILYTSGSTAKPKGILHTTGGYLTGVAATHKYVFDLKPERDVYWCAADVGWVTGHSYIVYGPLCNGATSVMWEGAPDYPHQGIWWELIERYKATILYAAPTAIRTFIKWGADIPAKFDFELAAAARLRRRADQPEGVAVVPHGDRRRALSDRRHVVADGDRRDHDHAAAGDHGDEAGLGDDAVPGCVGRGRRRERRRADRERAGAVDPHAAVAVDAARALQGGRPLRRDVLRALRQRDVPRRRRGAARSRRLHLGDRADRRCRQRLRPPPLDGRGRVGDRRAREGSRGCGDRPARRGDRPVDLRVRDAEGRHRPE